MTALLERHRTMFLRPTAGPPVDVIDPGALVGAFVGVALFSLLAAVTRMRLLSVLCRLGAIACALYPATVAWSWLPVADPTGTLAGRDLGAMYDLFGASPASPSLPDLGHVGPPTGLEALALVWAAALVAFFLLTVRADRQPG